MSIDVNIKIQLLQQIEATKRSVVENLGKLASQVSNIPPKDPVVDPPLPPKNPDEENEIRVKEPTTGGFIWKPVSESSGGRAVVIFPTKFTTKIDRVYLSAGTWKASKPVPGSGWLAGLEHGDSSIKWFNGRYTKDGKPNGEPLNGGREHWWLPRTGSKYGTRFYVVAVTKDNTFHTFYIKDGSQRYS